jgi:hypothetical protein
MVVETKLGTFLVSYPLVMSKQLLKMTQAKEAISPWNMVDLSIGFCMFTRGYIIYVCLLLISPCMSFTQHVEP